MRTRRQFVREAALALAAAALAPASAGSRLELPFAAASPPLRLDYATFSELVFTPFRAFVPGAPAANWVLIKTTNQRPRSGGECFSLTFRTCAEAAIGQGTYRIEHAKLGAFQLFVVPKPADGHGRCMEAVFNQLA